MLLPYLYFIMNTMQLSEETTKEFLFSTQGLQVKMFVHNDPKEAEKTIAQWLKQHNISIKHITQSQSEKGGNFIFVVLLFYQQNN